MNDLTHMMLIRTPEDEVGYYRFTESLGLGYIAATLREAGFRAEIVDGTIDGIDIDGIVDMVLETQPLAVGFSVVFHGYEDVQEIVARLRSAGYQGHITVGQHFATFNAERILNDTPGIDSVVRFEGEQTAIELVRALENSQSFDHLLGLAFRSADGTPVLNPPRPLITDLDTLPFPARDVLDRNRDRVATYNIAASRGCPWRCNFCTIATFYREPEGKLWRNRSPANIVDELEHITVTYGSKPFFFVDDQFLGSGRRGRRFALELANEILDRGLEVRFGIETRADTGDHETFALLKRAGLRLVFLGVESGYQPTLDAFQKDITVEKNLAAIKVLQEVGLDIQMGFIMFHEHSTLVEVEANLDFLDASQAFDSLPFFNELKIQAGSTFMTELGDGDLNSEYQRTWHVIDPSTRAFKEALQRALMPLAVPAYMLKMEQRFLGAIAEPATKKFESRLRGLFMQVATELLQAAKGDGISEELVATLGADCEQEAARLRTDIDVQTLLGRLRSDREVSASR